MKRRANLALPSRITTGGLAQEKEKRRIPRMELGS